MYRYNCICSCLRQYNRRKKNVQTLKTLINKSKKHPKTKICFPEGIFHFDGSISLKNSKNLLLSGNNTVFINTRYSADKSDYLSSSFFTFTDCENISIENISFDYLNYSSINGTVISSDADSLTLQIPSSFRKKGYHNPVCSDEYMYAINELEISPKNSIISDIYLNNPVKLIANNHTQTVTLNNIPYKFKIGNTAILRFSVGNTIPAFMFENTNNVLMKNISVYSCPSAVIYSTASCSDFTFNNMNIAPSPGSPMIFSSNVDGIHLKNFSGKVSVNNCSFYGMGDDSLNINSRAAVVTDVKSDYLTIESGYLAEKLPSKWAKKDDLLKFYTSDWECIGQARVKSLKGKKLHLTDVKGQPIKDCYIQNTRYLPEISVKNTIVSLSRPRALMLRSHNITVDNCTFENTALSAIIVSPDISRWYEMSPSENVFISNCSFNNCYTAYTSENDSVIAIKYADDNFYGYSSKIHKNISILSNQFNSPRANALFASGVNGLTIDKNSSNPPDNTHFAVIKNSENVIYNDTKYSDISYLTF